MDNVVSNGFYFLIYFQAYFLKLANILSMQSKNIMDIYIIGWYAQLVP